MDKVWYLAYGSNMSKKKFVHDRDIIPYDAVTVRVPGWGLRMNIPGLPYSEPSFSSIGTKTNQPDVIGVAYLLDSTQFVEVLASEGGGTAYSDIEVDCEVIGKDQSLEVGSTILAHTRGAAMHRNPQPHPSRRYMDIIIDGSKESSLPEFYQLYLNSLPVYQEPTSYRRRIGASLFLAVWGPIMALLEKVTHVTMKADGYAPQLIIWLVRFVMWMIWSCHDIFFAPIFGRGDGLDQTNHLETYTLLNKEKDSCSLRD